MNPDILHTLKHILSELAAWLKRVFDLTAAWVTQLSWWKFIVFAVFTLSIGGILQDSLFSPSEPQPAAQKKKSHASASSTARSLSDIKIDSTGIHITTDGPIPAQAKAKDAQAKAQSDVADESSPSAKAPMPTPPATPPTPADADKAAQSMPGHTDIHINLPPEVVEKLSGAIDSAADDAAEQEIEGYREKSSTWFMNFVLLLVVGLFAIKFLMGGKKRAEAQAAAANAAAERETLQRQVTEAKMQMMQAQVEPHFLFNTLASVEHLIETDPPRASAMQRSLIQYLRAVLPQMRETAAITNLGREADMVRAYLDLLKMRMEERLQVDFQVPEGLRSAAFPPMMLQSLVENAIKHGLEGKEEGGTLRVTAEVAHNKLRVCVTDDGMGFGVVPSTSTGLGLQSIRERLKLLHGQQAQLIIAPNSPSGVVSTIEVPYQLAVYNS
jgi:chemotaxis protein histidine kinase CheA